jgi:5'-deoxynucleotidase YfbR-like HD superfamily hydrolase
MVSQIVLHKFALAGLLHDASEAYLTDIASPIKHELLDYQELENTLMLAISQRYHFDYDYREVKYADLVMLATERRDLMNPCELDWFPMPPPLEEKLIPWPWDIAEFLFLRRFYELI